MGRLALVLAVCAVAASSATAAPRIPGRILSTTAVGGPEQAGNRIAWFEPAGRGCGHLAVRDSSTLRKHDLGARVCPNEGVPGAFTYGAGTAFWTDDYCGNECYQDISILGPGRPFLNAEDGDVGYDDYTRIGRRIEDAAGDARHLVYLENTREVEPASADACDNGGDCPTVITHSAIEPVAGGPAALQLTPPSGVVALALYGDTLALERDDGTVELRSIRTGRVQRTLGIPEQGYIDLTGSYVAVRTVDTLTAYRRSDGTPALVVDTAGVPFAAWVSDAAVVTATDRALVVDRFDGRSMRIPLHTRAWPVVSLEGRRLAWSDGRTIRMLLLPR
jgi:hypothetical protein